MTESKLLPQVPVFAEYLQVKNELLSKIEKVNSIQVLTSENQKEVKKCIAEINKVKDRISRFRIDNTNNFLKYIEPYIEQCKELEKLCTDGVSEIKSKMAELENKEREEKTITLARLFDIKSQQYQYRKLFNFDMFFEKSMANKTSSINVVEAQMKEWLDSKSKDIDFIKNNTDEPDAIISIYLNNGLCLTSAIESYQEQFKSESEIKALLASEEASSNTLEKKLDLRVTIKQLPKTKALALQSFLSNLGVEFNVEVI